MQVSIHTTALILARTEKKELSKSFFKLKFFGLKHLMFLKETWKWNHGKVKKDGKSIYWQNTGQEEKINKHELGISTKGGGDYLMRGER